MKIQKGKLSTSNAVVIGVLVVLLYLVMPTDARKKSSTSAAAESPEIPATQSPTAVSDSIPTTHSQDPAAISATIAAASKDVPQELAMPPIGEIDEHQLRVLVSENPFRTSAAVNALESRSQDAPESMTEVTESSPLTSAPIEQQSARISLIYTSSRGTKAAVLNDQIVYPGSTILDNARVLSVHPQGIEIQSNSGPALISP